VAIRFEDEAIEDFFGGTQGMDDELVPFSFFDGFGIKVEVIAIDSRLEDVADGRAFGDA